ncbi:hypothetical protein KBZ07_07965 [Cyanobium sp. BA20m-14]|uniref:hypothetical protein n=1 Tax=Cyanobium sp. BA20m-14 TaxID=2823703 RepID=UPI0020CE3950|nr:hypothetical protein [Cyanobium sp. BA20m-14]MCP9913342.1 hypothetical protein [Cyanobium sp. BA20m-14]
MRRRWLLIPVILSGACMGYWAWLVQRTEDVYTGVSLERLRYAHLSDTQRRRMTCFGAHGRLDAARGHPRDFCRPFLREAGLLP